MAPPHVALFPCAGMGHLLPFLRLSAMLSSRGCHVTLITAHPTVSAAESRQLSSFLAAHPTINHLDFPLLPPQKSQFINDDPFFIQIESINRSAHLLRPILSSLSAPPLSALIADFPVLATLLNSEPSIPIPTYAFITTSARFFSLMTRLPQEDNSGEFIEASNIPPPMLSKTHFFSANIRSNVSSLSKAEAVFINTFASFEPEAIESLRMNGRVVALLPIGPLDPFDSPESSDPISWLDEQEGKSVIFISFGSRTALSKDQTTELAKGVEKSGCKFLWALKSTKVDKDERFEKAEDVLGESFVARTKGKGVVVKGWVDQERVLGHVAVGGFVSHCGWNSVMEAARLGVPVMAWPQHGDQRVNAEVVEKSGLGVWPGREWGWGGEKLVGGNEIAEKMRDLIVNKELRGRVKEVKRKALEAREVDGSSEVLLQGFIDCLKKGKEE